MLQDISRLRTDIFVKYIELFVFSSFVAFIAEYYFHSTARRDVFAAARAEVARHADIAATSVQNRLRRSEALHMMARVATQRWLASGDKGLAIVAFAEIRSLLQSTDTPGSFERLAIVTPAGKVIWNSLTEDPDFAIPDRDYFKEIIAGQSNRAFSSPIPSRATDGEVTAYAEAVRGAGGAIIAVTVVTFPPAALLSFGELQDEGIRVGAAVLRPDGQYLTPKPAGLASETELPAELRAAAFADGAAERVIGGAGIIALRRIPGYDLLMELNADAAPVLAEVDRRFLGYDLIGATAIAFFLAALTLLAGIHRRATELAATRQASEAMRLVTDNIDEIIVLFEMDERGGLHHRFVSPSIERMLGIAPDDLIAQGGRLRLVPADLQAMDGRIAALRRGETVPDQDFRALDVRGNTKWFSVSTRRIAEDLRFAGRRMFIASWRNITTQREAEAAIATRDVRIESLVANINGGLFDCDFSTESGVTPGAIRLHYLSPGIPRLSGYSTEFLLQPGAFVRMTSPETLKRRDGFFREVLAEGQAAWEYAITRPNGSVIHVRERARLISGDQAGGRIVGFSVDITDEVALRERLVESARLAMLGELAASIAHEINQPLSVIALRAAMLAEASEGRSWAQQRVAASGKLIGEMVERVAVVIHGIREFARRDAASPEPFDPAKACAAAIVIVEPHLKDRPATFRTAAPPVPLAALGHVGSFEQVLINLFTNAIDAYDHSCPGVERLIEIAMAGTQGQLVVTVTDHAGGIPLTVLPNLFDAFFTTKPAGKGTGLGLAICQRIMHDMGGTITAANTIDGAAFTLTVPMAA